MEFINVIKDVVSITKPLGLEKIRIENKEDDSGEQRTFLDSIREGAQNLFIKAKLNEGVISDIDEQAYGIGNIDILQSIINSPMFSTEHNVKLSKLTRTNGKFRGIEFKSDLANSKYIVLDVKQTKEVNCVPQLNYVYEMQVTPDILTDIKSFHSIYKSVTVEFTPYIENNKFIFKFGDEGTHSGSFTLCEVPDDIELQGNYVYSINDFINVMSNLNKFESHSVKFTGTGQLVISAKTKYVTYDIFILGK